MFNNWPFSMTRPTRLESNEYEMFYKIFIFFLQFAFLSLFRGMCSLQSVSYRKICVSCFVQGFCLQLALCKLVCENHFEPFGLKNLLCGIYLGNCVKAKWFTVYCCHSDLQMSGENLGSIQVLLKQISRAGRTKNIKNHLSK